MKRRQFGPLGSARGPREEPGPKRGLLRLGGGSESSSAAARATGGAPSTRSVRDGVPAGGAARAVITAGQIGILGLALLVAASSSCTGGSRNAGTHDQRNPHVRIAIGGQNQLIYLPVTLAAQLGFYQQDHLDVELQDFPGGAKALEALVGGSADVVCGFYDHTIQMAAEGKEMIAFVSMLNYPGLVLVTSPQSADTVVKIEDLRGHVAGVTTAGSSSHMLLNYLLRRHGLTADAVSVTAIGSAATAIAALEHGRVDAGMMAEPAFTLLTKRNPKARVLADLRDSAGVKDAFGTDTYPAGVLYAKGDWMRANHETAGALARAIVHTLQWIHSHSPQEIMEKTPKAFLGGDESLYVEALKNSLAMFSSDGHMTAEGADAVHKLIAASIDKVGEATIDLSKTYTNEFIQ
jgi:NitT/TauT family transport system substrate-binding protein